MIHVFSCSLCYLLKIPIDFIELDKFLLHFPVKKLAFNIDLQNQYTVYVFEKC